VLACIAVVVHKRSEAYHYNVNDDYVYDFAHAQAATTAVALRGGLVDLPLARMASDSAFLRVKVHASLLGHWFSPQVQVSVNGGESVQTLERGARGVRFINLSGLPLTKNGTLRLVARHMRIDDQQAALLVIPNRWDAGQPKVLVISPHPDDGEIAAFGFYSRSNSYVLTLTAGEAGEERFFRAFPGGPEQFLEKGRVRVWNSVTVPLLGNVAADRVANLGYFDGTLTRMYAGRNSPVTSQHSGVTSLSAFRGPQGSELLPASGDTDATWTHLVKDLEYVIDRIKPDVIVTPYPAIDVHPDHQLATIAVIEALKNLGVHTGRLLLYTNHFTRSYMFPYGERGEAISLPPSSTPLYFDGIYSPPLSPSEQGKKLFALDAMIDLRPDTDWGSLRNARATLLGALRMSLSDSSSSYFRRAVRANELFFVVNVASLYDESVLQAVETRSVTP
jgi:LmbE family N-acetylglucosaminyl deacetylase